jgi:hypothetical protein
MNQKSPLLKYKTICSNENDSMMLKDSMYSFTTGLWEDLNTEPMIKLMLQTNEVMGTTLITKTREGVDRSERS